MVTQSGILFSFIYLYIYFDLRCIYIHVTLLTAASSFPHCELYLPAGRLRSPSILEKSPDTRTTLLWWMMYKFQTERKAK